MEDLEDYLEIDIEELKKEFVPFEESLQLKNLGFDKKCLGSYSTKDIDKDGNIFDKYELHLWVDPFYINAPLYRQAFRWFRDIYNLDSEIYLQNDIDGKYYSGLILSLVGNVIEWKTQNTTKFQKYEDAEIDCLKKLIELVK